MAYPYGVISDVHCFDWSQFSKPEHDGVNSRLRITLNEIYRCAKTVRDMGGSEVYVTGDLFHVRGELKPSVLNPVLDAFKTIIKHMGMKVYILPGNHDLETRESTKLGSAVRALEGIGAITTECAFWTSDALMVPWCSSVPMLRESIRDAIAEMKSEGIDHKRMDLMIHAPVDEVVSGVPSHGLTAEELGKLGFKRVFAGHYHNHKDFGNNVFSVGALAHQTWSDVGSKAGFMIVTEEDVCWFASHAPQFIDVSSATDKDDLTLMADGNYVRAKIGEATEIEIVEWRETLTDLGAAGILIDAIKAKTIVTRTGGTVAKSVEKLEESVSAWVNKKGFDDNLEVEKLCLDILSEAKVIEE